ncbi:MAG: glutamate--tRNA ligase [Deltaproteobacteria bacterium]|nr:glutamate--tRNA ligase [Deltaproteobacteria bacterium]
MGKVRVRFAPSPTGYLHIGNARTALFNYLFAKKSGGAFILRIEDTDRERSKKEFEDEIINDLRWLGLDWNEGPDKGGIFTPYRQSERQDIYDHMISQLLGDGKAYKCFCTEDELERIRLQQIANGEPPRYNGKCRDLAPLFARSYEVQGKPHTIRFRVEAGIVEVEDLVKGMVSFDCDKIGDFVIRRSDGTAAFNFANIVDDSLMRVTHVIRGDDHLSNTPRQILISEALRFIPPEFGHLPLILGTDRAPLSKRHGDVSLKSFRERGYLKEALVNYLAHLGLSYGEGRDLLSMDELIDGFSLDRVASSPAVFDIDKLNWINSHYIRNCEPRKLRGLLLLHLVKAGVNLAGKGEDWIEDAVDVVKGEASTLAGLAEHIKMFIEEVQPDSEAHAVLKETGTTEVIKAFKEEFEKESSITPGSYKAVSERVKARLAVKGKALFMPLRAALTGRTKGPEMEKVLMLLGKEEIIKRLQKAVS